MKTQEDISLILSGLRALYGNITPPLRSASIELKNKKVVWKCIFDTNATEDDYELVSVAAAEIIADFPDYGLEEIYLSVPHPQPAEPLKNLLYQRHELNSVPAGSSKIISD